MIKKPLRVGLVGYGFMGRAHSNAYCKAGHFFDLPYEIVLQAACARNEEKLQAFATNWGYHSIETDWRKLVERDDIDVIDICTPNNSHAEIAIAAAKNGKAMIIAGFALRALSPLLAWWSGCAARRAGRDAEASGWRCPAWWTRRPR